MNGTASDSQPDSASKPSTTGDQEPRITVIIPVHNGERILGRCLKSIFDSSPPPFEVVVVDDRSSDGSAAVASKFPCRLIRLESRRGAGFARNEGARAAGGEILFFTDQDCLLEKDALLRTAAHFTAITDLVVGGTYTTRPVDSHRFCSVFQSLHVHYFETRKARPDYVAAHAMALPRALFLAHGGFPETPIMGRMDGLAADVELCHRLRAAGVAVKADATILVNHHFEFSPLRSLRNAAGKSYYWTLYAIEQGGMFSDSGSASTEMKLSGIGSGLSLLFMATGLISGSLALAWLSLLMLIGALAANIRFYRFILEECGPFHAVLSAVWYTLMLIVILAASGLATGAAFLRRMTSKRESEDSGGESAGGAARRDGDPENSGRGKRS